MSACCRGCLRRAELIGALAPWIAGIVGRRRSGGARTGRTTALLALDDHDLVAALGEGAAAAAREFDRTWSEGAARERARRSGAEALCGHSGLWPARLRDLVDPPAALFVIGGARRLAGAASEPAAAIVGARRASPYGVDATYEIARLAGAAGLPVVSGLAIGIDAAAHRGALDGRGLTVAVLGGGVDVPYPRINARLYQRIRRERGLVVSEMPPGARPYRWSFPARNRIMAALATVVLVSEARERSGSLITSEFALELDRVLGALPGRVTSPTAAGTNQLLRDGALTIRGAEDLLDAAYGAGVRPAEPAAASASLEPELATVLDAVASGLNGDALVRATRLDAARVRAALGRLELLGLVTRHGLGTYERSARR